MNQVQAELVEGLVDELGREGQGRVFGKQRARWRRVVVVEPVGQRRGVVVDGVSLGSSLQQVGDQRNLVERAQLRVADDAARALGALDPPPGAEILQAASILRKPGVGKLGVVAKRPQLEREGLQLGAPDREAPGLVGCLHKGSLPVFETS